MLLRRTLPLVLLAGLGVVGLASSDSAQADESASGRRPGWRPPPVDTWRPRPVQAQFQAELIDDNLAALPTFLHNGKKFVMGTMGQRYRIRVTNPTAQRVEAVVSVDGLDAIDGQTASTSKRGYVVPAFGSVTIDGFRTSMDSVAAFRFTSVSDSFAGRTAQDRNVGVIGVAIFKEKVEEPIEIARPRAAAPSTRSDSAGAAESRSSAAKKPTDRPGLGTQFGEQRESRVRQTTFIRESSSPSSLLEMRYNDKAGLRAMGITIPEPQPIEEDDIDLRNSATPFPADRRFAQPPP
ncbi:MAG TPA: hypothetical protein PKA58_06340 [Polyangium sp.]|nr:hypothetical protein [Polyangium sp.]